MGLGGRIWLRRGGLLFCYGGCGLAECRPVVVSGGGCETRVSWHRNIVAYWVWGVGGGAMRVLHSRRIENHCGSIC